MTGVAEDARHARSPFRGYEDRREVPARSLIASVTADGLLTGLPLAGPQAVEQPAAWELPGYVERRASTRRRSPSAARGLRPRGDHWAQQAAQRPRLGPRELWGGGAPPRQGDLRLPGSGDPSSEVHVADDRSAAPPRTGWTCAPTTGRRRRVACLRDPSSAWVHGSCGRKGCRSSGGARRHRTSSRTRRGRGHLCEQSPPRRDLLFGQEGSRQHIRCLRQPSRIGWPIDGHVDIGDERALFHPRRDRTIFPRNPGRALEQLLML